jgi:Uma2 family endonuclease
MCNDTGIVTDRGPDTVRGADVAYYSYARLPKEADLEGYPPVAPELVIEVRSPSDALKATLAKVAEYLNAGVSVVCVVDPKKDRAQLFYPDRESETVLGDRELRLPDLLPGFNIFVRDFFE